jgi:tRNA isopentenyl-2-thiomethyl-A-37 hydroxylase MiaE
MGNCFRKSKLKQETSISFTKKHVSNAVEFALEIMNELPTAEINNEIKDNIIVACKLHTRSVEYYDIQHPKYNTYDLISKKLNIKEPNIIKLIIATYVETYNDKNMDNLDLARLIIRCSDMNHITKTFQEYMKIVIKINTEIGYTCIPLDHIKYLKNYAIPQFTLLNDLCKTQKTQEWLASACNKLYKWSSC